MGKDQRALGLIILCQTTEQDRFARARRGVDDDVFARAQRSDGLLLPRIWDRGLGEGELFGRWFRFG